MEKLRITTINAPQESVDRLYDVLKMGRCAAIPVTIDGEVKPGIIMIREDLKKLDMLHVSQLLGADKEGQALIYPIHIREAIGKLIDEWTTIALWVRTSDRSMERMWSGPAKDLPKEYRECHILKFMEHKEGSNALNLAITMEE